MRLDYALYGLAVIFFVAAAVSLVAVSDQAGRMLLTVSTAVIGLVSAGSGFMLKPKVQTSASTSTPAVMQEASAEQTPQVATAIEAPVVEAPTIEVSTTAVETPQAETPKMEMPVTSEVPVEAPAAEPTAVTSTVEVPLPTTEALTTATNDDLTQVKGIGEKRATQLKANGITSLDDLAKADAADLAAKLKFSPKIVEKWVAGAKNLTK